MTHSDAFLVEKLREILLRLYPTPQTSPFLSRASLLPTSAEGENSSQFQEPSGSSYPNGESETEYSEGELGLDEGGGVVINGVVHNLSTFDHNESAPFIPGNFTMYPPLLSEAEGSGGSDDRTTTALTRNLQEFIQVLKMSLSSAAVGVDGGKGGGSATSTNNLFSQHTHLSPSSMGMDVEGDSSELEFNLTLEDILDLNNLLDGSENTVQLKNVLIIVLYFLIACISIIGNLLVVQLVIRSRRLHTLTHALLANLAVADLFMATLNIPFSAARVILSEWPFGTVLCHLVPFVQVTSVYVTSITMTVIAVDRYSVIMNPLGSRMKSSQGVLLVLAIWILSALFSLPYALHQKVVRVFTVGVVQRCQAEFGSFRKWLTVGTFLAQYFVPLLLTTISYVSIMQRLRHRSTALGSTTPRQIAAQSRAKKKTIKMLALTVAFFAVSWAPINIYHLLTHFLLVRHNSTAILVCHLIAMSSCTVNPFIYCWFNDHFRREALKWMRCFRTRRCPIVHPGVEINGMLTRADRVCPPSTQSATTFLHSSGGSLKLKKSPHLTRSYSQQLSVPSSGEIGRRGQKTHITMSTSSPCSSHQLKQAEWHFRAGGQNGESPLLEVRYKERPESLFLVRTQSLDDGMDISMDVIVGIGSGSKPKRRNDGLASGSEEEKCLRNGEAEQTIVETEFRSQTRSDEDEEEQCDDYAETVFTDLEIFSNDK